MLELLVVLMIVAVIGSIGHRHWGDLREMSRAAKAAVDIRVLEVEIQDYYRARREYPTSLAVVGRDKILDPWGNPYEYLRLAGTKSPSAGARKDRFLVPLNSDFDLYSKGFDGLSQPALTAKVSRDDVLRANDGAFVGLAREF
jgi:general secretion pathway protein G